MIKSAILSSLVIVGVSGLGATSAWAQFCNTQNAPQSVSGESFDITTHGAKVALDTRSNLMWLRCPMGFSWNDESGCVNVSASKKKYSWQEALQEAERFETDVNGVVYEDWRLPNVRELMSIVDARCIAPAFNAAIFPLMPASLESGFWSNSPLQTKPAPSSVEAWFIKSGFGEIGHAAISELNFVILVRSM